MSHLFFQVSTYPDVTHWLFKQVLSQDMKKNLCSRMKELLNQGMKIQAIQAWGWFIRFLGSHAVRHRHLINEMLKIPERTFSDHDAQVQVASQVYATHACVFLDLLLPAF